jgi:hypothetical protein
MRKQWLHGRMIGAKRCIKSFGSTPHLVSYEVCLCLCCEIGHIAKPKSFPLLLARITIPRDAIHEELYDNTSNHLFADFQLYLAICGICESREPVTYECYEHNIYSRRRSSITTASSSFTQRTRPIKHSTSKPLTRLHGSVFDNCGRCRHS